MRAMTWKVTTALVLALGLTAPLEAQRRAERDDDRDDDRIEQDDDHRYGDRQGQRGGEKGGRVDDDFERSRTADRRGESYERSGRGNGPSFCRSGRGHPVFGWEWCDERGWDRSNSRYPVRWEERGWDDVVFGRTDRRGSLDRRGLGDVLGSVVFGRLDTRRRELGSSADWIGSWVSTSRGRELRVTAGGVPIARLVDRNGDRRVDSVFLAER